MDIVSLFKNGFSRALYLGVHGVAEQAETLVLPTYSGEHGAHETWSLSMILRNILRKIVVFLRLVQVFIPEPYKVWTRVRCESVSIRTQGRKMGR